MQVFDNHVEAVEAFRASIGNRHDRFENGRTVAVVTALPSGEFRLVEGKISIPGASIADSEPGPIYKVERGFPDNLRLIIGNGNDGALHGRVTCQVLQGTVHFRRTTAYGSWAWSEPVIMRSGYHSHGLVWIGDAIFRVDEVMGSEMRFGRGTVLDIADLPRLGIHYWVYELLMSASHLGNVAEALGPLS